MKVLEVYLARGKVTNAPIYKKFSINSDQNNILTAKDLAENDIVFCIKDKNNGKYFFNGKNYFDYIDNQYYCIIKNSFGPIGNFTKEQFLEFRLWSDEEEPIESEAINHILENLPT